MHQFREESWSSKKLFPGSVVCEQSQVGCSKDVAFLYLTPYMASAGKEKGVARFKIHNYAMYCYRYNRGLNHSGFAYELRKGLHMCAHVASTLL